MGFDLWIRQENLNYAFFSYKVENSFSRRRNTDVKWVSFKYSSNSSFLLVFWVIMKEQKRCEAIARHNHRRPPKKPNNGLHTNFSFSPGAKQTFILLALRTFERRKNSILNCLIYFANHKFMAATAIYRCSRDIYYSYFCSASNFDGQTTAELHLRLNKKFKYLSQICRECALAKGVVSEAVVMGIKVKFYFQ